MTSPAEPNENKPEERDTRPPEPPSILDRLLGDMDAESAAPPPPKSAPPPSLRPPEHIASASSVPPKTPFPPDKQSKQTTTSEAATRKEDPDEASKQPTRETPQPIGRKDDDHSEQESASRPPPASPVSDSASPGAQEFHPPKTHASESRFVEPPPSDGPPRKRSFALAAVTAVMILNILLVILIVFLFQDRQTMRTASVTPGPPTDIDRPAPVEEIVAAPDAPPDSVPVDERSVEEEERLERPHPDTAQREVLHIPKLVLCRDVSGFAEYIPIPDMPLTAHHVPHIQAYVEIANPKPEEREDGRHIYYMTKSMRLYHSDIGPSEPLMDTAVSLVVNGLSPRRDFYSAHPLQASRRIEPGEYTLAVRITDQVSGESVTEEATFFVLGN